MSCRPVQINLQECVVSQELGFDGIFVKEQSYSQSRYDDKFESQGRYSLLDY
jgi:hypothetical protein